jgi:hypothetical protein
VDYRLGAIKIRNIAANIKTGDICLSNPSSQLDNLTSKNIPSAKD